MSGRVRTEVQRQFWREGEGWTNHVLIRRDEIGTPRPWRHRTVTTTIEQGEWQPDTIETGKAGVSDAETLAAEPGQSVVEPADRVRHPGTSAPAVTPEPVADDRANYYADQQAWREQRAAAPDAAQWEALANALREIGPQPGGVMHPDLVADRLLDHEWFAQTCERKQAEANRVPEPVADDRARVTAEVLAVGICRVDHPSHWWLAEAEPCAECVIRTAAVVAALPAQRAAADPRIEAIRAETLEAAAKAIESARNQHWQRRRGRGRGATSEKDYGKHDAYYHAAKIVRAALGDQP